MGPLLNDAGTKLHPFLKKQEQRRKDAQRGRRGKREGLSPAYVVSQLKQRDMLPAIYFIFSRRGCDRAVTDMGKALPW
jgi:superfamily II RNA helicase